MRRDGKPWGPMPGPELSWEEDGTPRSTRHDDIYYSTGDGAAESEQVFLAGNDLPQRWASHPRDSFVIAETGFGTGLNFLVTWHHWRQQADAPRLHFLSVERYPLGRDALQRALGRWPGFDPLTRALLQQYPLPLPGPHRLVFEGGRVLLDLWWGDAGACLTDWERSRQPFVDAWYLDGFAPSRNADLWQDDLLQRMARLSLPGATLATFTAAGAVRRGLQAAGFAVTRRPGYGRKREQLQASLHAAAHQSAWQDTPWEQAEGQAGRGRQTIVLGAGLAGSHCAAALARRGIPVTVLEAAACAGGASGNPQGVLYTRISHRHSTLVDFSHASYAFATRLYRQLFEDGQLIDGVDGALCGSLQLLPVGNAAQSTCLPALAEWLDARAASQRAGLALPGPAHWFPESGWLSPAAVCRALLATPGIVLRENLGALQLLRTAQGWQVRDSRGSVVAEADCVVIAAGLHSRQLAGLDWLPLKAVRGQTTQLPPLAALQELRAVLCHEGYIAPAGPGGHCIGATFQVGDEDTTVRPADQQINLAALARALPQIAGELQHLDPAQLAGRVGWRCASPDYLPLAGPVIDLAALQLRYAGLRSNARQVIARPAPVLPGLYLSTGHGSRGLTSTPLCAELIASQVCGEPLPLEPELQRALSPTRFPVRDLARNRC